MNYEKPEIRASYETKELAAAAAGFSSIPCALRQAQGDEDDV